MKKMELPGILRALLRFGVYCGRRFIGDQCLRIATQLSYASLLAIVPILAICLGLLSAFPAFEHLRMDAQVFLFENLGISSASEAAACAAQRELAAAWATAPGTLEAAGAAAV